MRYPIHPLFKTPIRYILIIGFLAPLVMHLLNGFNGISFEVTTLFAALVIFWVNAVCIVAAIIYKFRQPVFRVTGKVIDVRLLTTKEIENRYEDAEMTLEFSYEGELYTIKERTVSVIKPMGREYPIAVNKDDPSQSYIQEDSPWVVYIATFTTLVLFLSLLMLRLQGRLHGYY